MDVVINTLKAYEGNGRYIVLFLISLVYIFLKRRKEKKIVYFVSVALGTIILVIANPVAIKFLNEYMGFAEVYWRLFWLLPVLVIIAYAVTDLLKDKGVIWGGILVCGICVAVILCGSCIYVSTSYKLPENKYKLPAEVIEVSDIILDCSQEQEIKAIVPAELSWCMRQYTGKIKLLYGRDGRPFRAGKKRYAIYEQMSAPLPDIEMIVRYAKKNKYNFLVMGNGIEMKDILSEAGFELVGTVDRYGIYYMKQDI